MLPKPGGNLKKESDKKGGTKRRPERKVVGISVRIKGENSDEGMVFRD
jgi:hypothetical protein